MYVTQSRKIQLKSCANSWVDGAFFKGSIDIRKAGRKTGDDAKEVSATERRAGK